MTQLFLRIVAAAMLSVMVAAGAGTICLLPASTAHSHMAGCHSAPAPFHPQPADYRCCLTRHPLALLTNVFSPRPASHRPAAEAIDFLAAARASDGFSSAITPSGSPPDTLILRI